MERGYVGSNTVSVSDSGVLALAVHSLDISRFWFAGELLRIGEGAGEEVGDRGGSSDLENIEDLRDDIAIPGDSAKQLHMVLNFLMRI